MKLPLTIIAVTACLMTYNLASAHEYSEALTDREIAYDCMADQAYMPETFEEALDLIDMCDISMEEYVEFYHEEVEMNRAMEEAQAGDVE